jgi:hypothetical protein
MGDTLIIAEDEPKPAAPVAVIVAAPAPAATAEKVVTEKTTVTEIKAD